jgi:hypothetical protein
MNTYDSDVRKSKYFPISIGIQWLKIPAVSELTYSKWTGRVHVDCR